MIEKSALWFLINNKCFSNLFSVENPNKLASNSEKKRWLQSKSVLINDTAPTPDEIINFPVVKLIFFPKSEKRRITMLQTPYIYVFIRTDLPLEQQLVQSCHAVIETTKRTPPQIEHPHLVILQVKNETKLEKIANDIASKGIGVWRFFESDRKNELTSFATSVIIGEQREIFRKYPLWKHSHKRT